MQCSTCTLQLTVSAVGGNTVTVSTETSVEDNSKQQGNHPSCYGSPAPVPAHTAPGLHNNLFLLLLLLLRPGSLGRPPRLSQCSRALTLSLSLSLSLFVVVVLLLLDVHRDRRDYRFKQNLLIRIIRDGEPRTVTSTFTQLLKISLSVCLFFFFLCRVFFFLCRVFFFLCRVFFFVDAASRPQRPYGPLGTGVQVHLLFVAVPEL